MAREYVLYVGREGDAFDAGSTVCLALLDKLEHDVDVQDATVLRRSLSLPHWLTGTPFLVEDRLSMRWKGSDAILHLASLPRKEEATGRRTRSGGGGAFHAPPRDAEPDPFQEDGTCPLPEDVTQGVKVENEKKVDEDELKRMLKERESLSQPAF